MGLAVNVWTVNAPEDLRAMVDLGVDAVITDRLRRRPRRGGPGGGLSDPQCGATRKRACHRAEWRGAARVHKDGRP